MEHYITINNERSRIKVFEPFEDISKTSTSFDTTMVHYWCVCKRRSKPLKKGPRAKTIENVKKEYK